MAAALQWCMSDRPQRSWGREKPPCRADRQYWLVYDGTCAFCRALASWVTRLDILGRVWAMDLHTHAERIARRSPGLDHETLVRAVHLLSPEGNVWVGFEAVRRLAVILPVLWPLLPGFCAPGASFVGPAVYEWIARFYAHGDKFTSISHYNYSHLPY